MLLALREGQYQAQASQCEPATERHEAARLLCGFGWARRERTWSCAVCESRASGKRPRREESEPLVLVVDDYDDNREMYAEYFRHVGYRVETAADGEEALEKVHGLTPEVVLMDLELPVLDGWTATRIIKSDAKTEHICVVVVTGHATSDAMKRARDAGAAAVVTKPILPNELVEVVRQCCPPPEAGTRTRRRRLAD